MTPFKVISLHFTQRCCIWQPAHGVDRAAVSASSVADRDTLHVTVWTVRPVVEVLVETWTMVAGDASFDLSSSLSVFCISIVSDVLFFRLCPPVRQSLRLLVAQLYSLTTINLATVARAWNSLPTSITALTSLPSFKRQLRTFLFTKSFPSV